MAHTMALATGTENDTHPHPHPQPYSHIQYYQPASSCPAFSHSAKRGVIRSTESARHMDATPNVAYSSTHPAPTLLVLLSVRRTDNAIM